MDAKRTLSRRLLCACEVFLRRVRDATLCFDICRNLEAIEEHQGPPLQVGDAEPHVGECHPCDGFGRRRRPTKREAAQPDAARHSLMLPDGEWKIEDRNYKHTLLMKLLLLLLLSSSLEMTKMMLSLTLLRAQARSITDPGANRRRMRQRQGDAPSRKTQPIPGKRLPVRPADADVPRAARRSGSHGEDG